MNPEAAPLPPIPADRREAPRGVSPEIWIICIAILSLVAKLYCAATTVGPSDVPLFFQYAEWIHGGGLLSAFEHSKDFNHTPLTGWYIHTIYRIAGTGKDPLLFATLMRLPAIFADVLAVAVLLWIRARTGRPGWLALGLFAGSPVAFMISGYHGNLDSVLALGVLLAGAACVAERPVLCGIFLGLSCNIKIVPVLLAPVFFFYWLHRGRSVSFLLAAVLCILGGWSYPLLSFPGLFLKNVLGYSSYWGHWGFTYLFRSTGIPFLQRVNYADFSEVQVMISTALKAVIIGSSCGLAWAGRRCTPDRVFRTLALVWAAFFIFTPGFGAQYLAWLAPCLLLSNDRWYIAVTAASSVALFVFYNRISGGMPWNTGFEFSKNLKFFLPWFMLPWLTITGYFARECWIEWKKRARSSTLVSSDDGVLTGSSS